jgi:serine/threonine-protein kinase RsbW
MCRCGPLAAGDRRRPARVGGKRMGFGLEPRGNDCFKKRRSAGDTVGSERLGAWEVSAVPSSVPRLRRALRAAIAGRGFDEDAVALAATEAVTNVVRHAYQQPGGSVALSATASADELTIVVADEGLGSRSLTLQGDAKGLGMGLALIRELCAHVRIEPTHTGTTLAMLFTKQR